MKVTTTALHEAGHAVARYLNGEPLGSLSIVPEGVSLGRFKPDLRPEDEKFLQACEQFWQVDEQANRAINELDELRKGLPAIDYEDSAEMSLAGEAAEVICGAKKAPDWEGSGYLDWCQAHGALFRRLDIPFNDEGPIHKAIPEALQLVDEFIAEMVRLYFDFLFRRVSLKLKRNWPLVEAVAVALTERKQLDADDIYRAIKQALGVCSSCGEELLAADGGACKGCGGRVCPECAEEMGGDRLCGVCLAPENN